MVQLLKKRRVELGKKINEAAEITRIKESYLKAIEEEDFSKLPIEVYTKGYIREYAKFLGVYSEDTIAKYDRYLDEKKGIKSKVVADTAADKPLNIEVVNEQASHKGPLENVIAAIPPSEISGTKGSPFPRKAFMVIPLLVIIIAVYFLMPQSENVPTQKPEQSVPVPVQQMPQADIVQQGNQVVPQIPSENADDKTKDVKAEVKAKSDADAGQQKKYSLDIKATDKVWLQIIIDGSEKKEMTLNVGDRLVYGANESFNILVGNAAGVNLKYNDKSFGVLGEKGQVVRLNLPEMNSPQVVTLKKKDSEIIPSELPKSQTSNHVKQ